MALQCATHLFWYGCQASGVGGWGLSCHSLSWGIPGCDSLSWGIPGHHSLAGESRAVTASAGGSRAITVSAGGSRAVTVSGSCHNRYCTNNYQTSTFECHRYIANISLTFQQQQITPPTTPTMIPPSTHTVAVNMSYANENTDYYQYTSPPRATTVIQVSY